MEKYLREKFNEEQLLTELNNPESIFFIALLNAEIIGFLKLNSGRAQTEMKEPNGLEIERIYVLDKYIGKGIGKHLLNLAFQIPNKKNAHYIWLGVWEKNERAIAFYKKYGFVEFDTHVFVLGEDVQTDVLMKLNLLGSKHSEY